MSESKKSSTILFADIVGYTALMEAGEQQAMTILDRFQDVTHRKVQSYYGEVIKTYGDGALILFDKVDDALNCAREMQLAFQEEPEVPLRIGIHVGEVIKKKNDVFGNAVNVCARIESMGIGGAVLLSENAHAEIDNSKRFKLRSLGAFEFKNVKEPIELYALDADGLPVPQRDQMRGKLKDSDSNGNYFQRLWHKKVPQFFIAYLLIAFLLLQIFDVALNQFGISPHWGKIFFTVVVGIIPSLLVYLVNRQRIHRTRMKLGEKILFPTNLALLGATIFFMFRGVDLGATTANVTFLNADGELEKRNVVKNEFKKQIPVFPFDRTDVDTLESQAYSQFNNAIAQGLSTNKYLLPITINLPNDRINKEPYTRLEKINKSKIYNSDIYIDGSYNVLDGNGKVEVTTTIRNRKNGELIKQQTFIGSDVFAVYDSVSMYSLNSVGLTKSQLDETIYIPIRELLTADLKALEYFAIGVNQGPLRSNLEKALEKDSTFAMAAVVLASDNIQYSRGSLEAKILLDVAMRHRKRLTFEQQISTMYSYHLVHKNWDKAEALMKLQLETDPSNQGYISGLMGLYLSSGQDKKAIQFANDQYQKFQNPWLRIISAQAALLDGKPEVTISRLQPLLLLDAQNVYMLNLKAVAYIHQKEYEESRKLINKIILIEPEREILLTPLLEAIAYMEEHPNYANRIDDWISINKSVNGEQIFDLQKIDNQLCLKVGNQTPSFLYPNTDTTFVKSLGNLLKFQQELTQDGNQKSLLISQQSFKQDPFDYRRWVHDDLLKEAEDLVWQKDYSNALIAYDKAITKHPEHFFLKGMKQHLDYLASKSEEDVQKELLDVVGSYDVRIPNLDEDSTAEFWVEDGLLYYKRIGTPRRVLRPIGNNRFVSMTFKEFVYEMDMSNGKVKGMFCNVYDYETETFERDQDWYFTKQVLLD